MKKILFFGFVLIALGCQTESDVDPSSGTFIRYYGSEKSHEAVQAIETPTGYTMVSNVEIPIEGTTTTGFKIKIIETDFDGNMIGQERSYPAFVPGAPETHADANLRASAIIRIVGSDPLLNSGYLIIGDRINEDRSTDLLLLQTNDQGVMTQKIITGADIHPDLAGVYLHGAAVVQSSDANGENYIILGRIEWPASITNQTDADMFVARISATDLSIGWTRQYGAGEGTLMNKLFANNDNLVWGGSVLTSNQHDVRMINVSKNSQLPNIGAPLQTSVEEIANDVCPALGGYVITGSTNDGGDEDIFVMKVSTGSDLVFYKRFDQSSERDLEKSLDLGLNDKGNSICTARDGSLIILATVESPETQNDLYIANVDAGLGQVLWTNSFGGGDREDGASVIATSDGNFLVFGTSYFQRVKKLMLVKVNSKGQL